QAATLRFANALGRGEVPFEHGSADAVAARWDRGTTTETSRIEYRSHATIGEDDFLEEDAAASVTAARSVGSEFPLRYLTSSTSPAKTKTNSNLSSKVEYKSGYLVRKQLFFQELLCSVPRSTSLVAARRRRQERNVQRRARSTMSMEKQMNNATRTQRRPRTSRTRSSSSGTNDVRRSRSLGRFHRRAGGQSLRHDASTTASPSR
ncbi:unnamed protein product, partial [Amoebophrya sp. A25]